MKALEFAQRRIKMLGDLGAQDEIIFSPEGCLDRGKKRVVILNGIPHVS
jgi:hypothetical protein